MNFVSGHKDHPHAHALPGQRPVLMCKRHPTNINRVLISSKSYKSPVMHFRAPNINLHQTSTHVVCIMQLSPLLTSQDT